MRTNSIQLVLDEIKAQGGITEAVEVGSTHPYMCRCQICLEWWRQCGPEEDADGKPYYGPFTEHEIKNGLPIS